MRTCRRPSPRPSNRRSSGRRRRPPRPSHGHRQGSGGLHQTSQRECLNGASARHDRGEHTLLAPRRDRAAALSATALGETLTDETVTALRRHRRPRDAAGLGRYPSLRAGLSARCSPSPPAPSRTAYSTDSALIAGNQRNDGRPRRRAGRLSSTRRLPSRSAVSCDSGRPRRGRKPRFPLCSTRVCPSTWGRSQLLVEQLLRAVEPGDLHHHSRPAQPCRSRTSSRRTPTCSTGEAAAGDPNCGTAASGTGEITEVLFLVGVRQPEASASIQDLPGRFKPRRVGQRFSPHRRVRHRHHQRSVRGVPA